MKNIDYELLQEQYEFLCLLSDDIRTGEIVLPSKYEELGCFPLEHLDGLFGLIGAVFDEASTDLTVSDLSAIISFVGERDLPEKERNK